MCHFIDRILYIQKVRNRYNEAPALSDTLEKLVQNEKAEKKNTATEGLMWLLRYVETALCALYLPHSFIILFQRFEFHNDRSSEQ